jgi:hypothetical protein
VGQVVGIVFCVDKMTKEEIFAICYFPTENGRGKIAEMPFSKAVTIKGYREALQNVGYVINEKTVEIDKNNYAAIKQVLVVDATILGEQAKLQLKVPRAL